MKLKQILLIAFLAGIITSCKKQLLDINTSPNDPTTASASPQLVLPNALNVTASIYDNVTGGNNNFLFAGLWMGQISYSGNYAISTENISYAITNNFGAGAWDNIYDNIEDYDFVQQKGAAIGNNFYRAIGMFMKAYNFQTLVDLYNNVPYTQALQGTAVSTPAFDNGKAIYADLSNKMDTAIALFKTSTNTAISGDVMFGGNATKWVHFANTVKLRLLLRQSEVNGAAAQSQAAALSGGFITSADDGSTAGAAASVNPGYLTSYGHQNPFWGTNYNSAGAYAQDVDRAGQFAINFYTSNNDPRLARFYAPTSTGSFQGNFFGDQGIPNSKTSTIGPGVLKAATQSAVIMLDAESYFLQAEAVLRGWLPGGDAQAQTFYQNGVTSSFIYLGLSSAQATTYYNQANNKQTTWAATSTFQDKLTLIITQKWAAETWINELEPFNDYRRLHLPVVALSTSPFSTGAIPNRLRYPQRELSVNSSNTLAAGSDAPTNKVWWQP